MCVALPSFPSRQRHSTVVKCGTRRVAGLVVLVEVEGLVAGVREGCGEEFYLSVREERR